MLSLDEDLLICDFAETYKIYDLRGLPLSTVAILACGLSDDSRIKRKLANKKLTLEQTLLASMVDRLSLLLWLKTEDARKRINKPKSVLEMLEYPPQKQYKSFSSVDEFERKRAQLLRS